MKKILPVLIILIASNCSSLSNLSPITNQHPAFAMNSGDCAILGTVLPALLGFSPIASSGAIFGAIAGKTVCQAESSIVAGPPAQITVTSSTSQGTTLPTTVVPTPIPTPMPVPTPTPRNIPSLLNL